MTDSKKAAWVPLGVAVFMAFAMFIQFFCVPPIQGIIRDTLAINNSQASLLFSGIFLTMVVIAIPAGLLADRIGVKITVGIGATVMTISMLLRSSADTYPAILAFTLLLGIGMGVVFPNMPKIISVLVPREKAGLATGLYSASLVGGAALALAITVPVILPVFGTIQAAFLIWAIPLVVATILWWVFVKVPHNHSAGMGSKSSFATSFRKVAGNKNIRLVAVLFLLHNFFFYTWTGWMPQLMQQRGASLEMAGLMNSVNLWTGIPVILIITRIAYKMGVLKPFLWFPGIALALTALAMIYTNLSWSWVLMIAMGITNAMRFPILLTLPVEMTEPENVGLAGGLILCVGYIGAIIGPPLGGYILDITGSLQLSIILLIAVAAATAVIGMVLPETGPKALKVRK